MVCLSGIHGCSRPPGPGGAKDLGLRVLLSPGNAALLLWDGCERCKGKQLPRNNIPNVSVENPVLARCIRIVHRECGGIKQLTNNLPPLPPPSAADQSAREYLCSTDTRDGMRTAPDPTRCRSGHHDGGTREPPAQDLSRASSPGTAHRCADRQHG